MNTDIDHKNSFIRNDILLILALLFIACVGAVYLFFFREQGNAVEVFVNGESVGVYSLSEDMEKDISSGDGNQFNHLVISGGKAYVESASCPDGICVSHHPIYRDGESIVCLPNGVVITVAIKADSNAPDVVV